MQNHNQIIKQTLQTNQGILYNTVKLNTQNHNKIIQQTLQTIKEIVSQRKI